MRRAPVVLALSGKACGRAVEWSPCAGYYGGAAGLLRRRYERPSARRPRSDER